MSVERGGQEVLEHLLLHRLFEVLDRSPADGRFEDFDDMREQRGQLVVWEWSFAVSRRERHQCWRVCRSARSRFAEAGRT